MSLPFLPHPAWPSHLLEPSLHLAPGAVRTALATTSPEVRSLSPTFLEGVCLPLAGWLASLAERPPRVIAVGGPPGSGKSTLVRAMAGLLGRLHALTTASFSLDDLYYTKAERLALARDVHPLLATRGVPGTHDLGLARTLLDRLVSVRSEDVHLPRFDKRTDDRAPESEWRRVTAGPQLIFVDAWFWGAAPTPEPLLKQPINAREAADDPDCSFRTHVNRQLAGPYADLFGRADVFIRLDAPDWQTTIAWRIEQERELLGTVEAADRERIEHFLELFERVALRPSVAPPDLILRLDREHELDALSGTVCRPSTH